MPWLKRLRRNLLLISLIALIITFFMSEIYDALLVDHPTGRRYASEVTLRTGGFQQLGADGERVLTRDLLWPNNNSSGRQCFCNSIYAATPPDRFCNACLVVSDSIASYRIPDFVAPNYIADSKNVTFLGGNSEYRQIRDFATAAQTLGVPLWIYVRIDTVVEQRFIDVVDSTGGGIVPYFIYAGYMDDIDRASRVGVTVSLVVFLLLLLLEIRNVLFKDYPASMPTASVPKSPPGGRPTESLKKPDRPAPAASARPRRPSASTPYRRAKSIESGVSDLKERARRRLDEEDARDDLDDIPEPETD